MSLPCPDDGLLKATFSSWRLPVIWDAMPLTGHNSDVIIGAIASQITSLTIVYSTVYSGADQRKHKSSASLAFLRGIHRWPVNSPHKGPVTRKTFPFDEVIGLGLLSSVVVISPLFVVSCILIFLRVTSLALGQSHDCPSTSEVSLKDLNKISLYLRTTEHSKTWAYKVCIYLGKHCLCITGWWLDLIIVIFVHDLVMIYITKCLYRISFQRIEIIRLLLTDLQKMNYSNLTKMRCWHSRLYSKGN